MGIIKNNYDRRAFKAKVIAKKRINELVECEMARQADILALQFIKEYSLERFGADLRITV